MFYKKSKEPSLTPELFANPGPEYRGAPFWAWNCRLNPEMLGEQIGYLHDMGFGGFHMHVRAGFDNPYLSDEHMSLVKYCVDQAKEKNMYAYLYDEDRWPSGFAGGLVTKDKQYRMRWLSFTNITDEPEDGMDEAGNETAAGAKSGRDRKLLGCFDVELDGNGCLRHYEMIDPHGEAKGEKWNAYLCVQKDTLYYNGQAYVNTLDKKSIDRFIDVTYKTYQNAVGDDFGKAVRSIFTDEPQFSAKGTLKFAREKRDVTLPWTDDLPDTYKAAYGEEIIPHLPELFWELPDGGVSPTRYHYHDHVTQRFTEAFADNCGRWCGENGLALTGHMMSEATLASQTGALGEAMRAYRGFQIPGIDMLCNWYEYTTAKQAQSAVHQYGREGMMSELYGVTNWTFDFRGHKNQGDWQAALGITLRVLHLSWISMAGESKRDYPASINYQSPWFREYPLIENHFARVNTALTRGKPVVKIGVIHPIESYWLHWGPSQQTALIRDQMQENFENITEWLLFGTLDFDFISESLLPELCAEGAAPLKVGEMAYDAVIVPACETLRKTTVERLEKFRKAGGRLIFLGKAPKYMDAVESSVPAQLYAESEQLDFSRSAVLEALKDCREVELRVDSGNKAGSYVENIIYQIRQDKDCRWIFFAHGKEPEMKDISVAENVRITLNGEYRPECYDTMTGEIYPLAAEYAEGKTILHHTFYNQDSLLLKLTPGRSDEKSEKADEPETRPFALAGVVPVTLEEQNVLMLDRAEYAIDEGEFFPETEILHIASDARKMLGLKKPVMQPWTMPEEPLTHTVHLRIPVRSQLDVENVSLALEDAERVQIKWNGSVIPSEITGWYVDHAIKTVKLGRLNAGENLLELAIPFGQRANVEWCYLLGDFGVRVNGQNAVVTEPVRELGFSDITAQGLPFYGGNVVYHLSLPAGKKAMIHVPFYRGSLVGVSAGGKRVGEIVFAPYNITVDVPADGKVDLTLFGNRANTFGPIHRSPQANSWFGPNAWTTEGDEWSDSYQLYQTGILSTPTVKICK